MSEAAHLTNDLFDADDVQDMAPMVVLEYEPTAADASQHPEQSTSSKVTDSTILGMDHATNDSLDVEDKSSTTIGEYKPPEVGTTQQPEQFLTSKKTDSIAAPQSNYTADSPDEIADILSTLGIQHKSPAVDAIHQPKQFVTSKTTDNIIMPEVDHIKDSLDDIADTVPTTDVEPQSTAVNASEQPEQLITTKTTGNIINAEVYDTTDSLPDATDTSSTMIQPELPAVNATQQSNHLANPQSMGTACNPEANDTEQASLHVKHITSSTEIEHKPLEVWHMRQQPEPLMHIGDLSGAQRSQLSQGPLAKFFIGDDLFETIPRDLWLAATTPFHAGPGLCTCMKIEMNSKAEIHFPEDTDRAALRYITDWLKSTLTDGDDPARRTPIAKGFPEPHRIAVNVYRLALRLGIIRYFGYMCKYLSLHMHHCWKLYPLSLSPSMMAFIEDGAANSLDCSASDKGEMTAYDMERVAEYPRIQAAVTKILEMDPSEIPTVRLARMRVAEFLRGKVHSNEKHIKERDAILAKGRDGVELTEQETQAERFYLMIGEIEPDEDDDTEGEERKLKMPRFWKNESES